jgi:hypothetical protein
MCADAEQVAGDWLKLGASRLHLPRQRVPDVHKLLINMHRRYSSTTGFAPNLTSFWGGL